MNDDLKGAFDAFFSPLFSRAFDCKVAVDYGQTCSATVTINVTPKHTLKAVLRGLGVDLDGQLTMLQGDITTSVMWHRKERFDFPMSIGRYSFGRFSDETPDMIAKIVRVAMLCALGQQRYDAKTFKRVHGGNVDVLIEGMRRHRPLRQAPAGEGKWHGVTDDHVLEAMAEMPFDRISRTFGVFGFQLTALSGAINMAEYELRAAGDAGYDQYLRKVA